MGNRVVRVDWAFCLCVFSMLSSGCLDSHGRDDPANPGGSDATDGGADESCAPFSLDLLFVIDNSESMREEQPALRVQLEQLVRGLTTGDLDGDGMQEQRPVADVHLGVVSADLGSAGLDGVPGCDARGDDAVLQHRSNAEVSGCASSFPSFVRYVDGDSNAQEVAADLGCIAALGTAGCAIEQPLEAALRALSSEGNEGFASTANRPSALGIVVVTDEDDCSVEDSQAFAADSDPSAPPAPNLRCTDRANALFDSVRYATAFRKLRPENEQPVFFSAIVGVPGDLLDPSTRGEIPFADRAERQERYQAILDDPRMEPVQAPDSTLEGGAALTPSCSVDNNADREVDSRAYPPRRIVEVVRDFGSRATLHSICDPDLTDVVQPMLDAARDRAESIASDCT